MEFRILGSVDMVVDGEVRRPGSIKERIVLASLALDVRKSVSSDTLINRLWEDRPPVSPRGNLRSLTSRLRKATKHPGTHQSPVVQQDHGYLLDVVPQSIDLYRYLGLSARARHLVDGGDDEGALQALDEAAPLWRGDPLAGITGLWAEEVRRSLTPRLLAAALIRAGIGLRRGHFADIVGALVSLTSQYPEDQRLAEYLMLALYGCGRTSEALQVYQRTWRRLREESGVEPDHRLRRLQKSILRNVPVGELVPGGVREQLRSATGPPPDNLPPAAGLVGRDQERSALRGALERGESAVGGSVALEAIEGMSGVGKTALAVAVGREMRHLFPDGLIYINLRAHAGASAPMSPAAALDFLLRFLGTPTDRIPRDLDSATSLWRAMLTQRRVLVLLDDAADPGQVRPLLPGDSPSVVVVTSRRRLVGIPGLRRITLSMLPERDAIALFRRLVGEERTRDDAEVADIVRLSGYLPLALEIMAGRLNSHPTWSLSDLTRRLLGSSQRISAIRDGDREIWRAFEFSYRLLTGEQQCLFRRLGLHVGPDITPEAVAALTGMTSHRAEHLLEDLLDRYLIQELVPGRYSLHDLLREYAQILASSEEPETERAAAKGQLIDFYLRYADAADRTLYPHRPRTPVDAVAHTISEWADQAQARTWLGAERENLLATAEHAWHVGPPRRAALFAHVLAGFHDAERLGSVAAELIRRAAAYWRTTEERAEEARALIDLCAARTHAGLLPDAVTAGKRALDLARSLGDADIVAEALTRLSLPETFLGNRHGAAELQREALDIWLRTSDRSQSARAQNNLAITLLHLGDLDTAQELFQSALKGFEASGHHRLMGLAHNNLGDIFGERDKPGEARSSYERALRIFETHGSAVERATVQLNLADLLQHFGEFDASLDLYEKALPVLRDAGERRTESIVLNGIGVILRRQGRREASVRHHEEALRAARAIGAAPEEAQALLDMAATEHDFGADEAAASSAAAALEVARRIGAESEAARAQELLSVLRS
ncbi:BTAD domain-containing putative transcriptional regulator [Streptomyces sp. MP131-18]|uniref:AfsR/SARP family transcriptional regulator n=1 Tax=Streptomyces sp. MP131-18 TaxID=1857892 RepID=UPI00097BB1BC|nr:BTAD domain-containing putative transcriptional regulator [Streptomyces sp. MP131-18]ONK15511.1 Regulatory protein AfsR [Streptomyces sp. MP131-18]